MKKFGKLLAVVAVAAVTVVAGVALAGCGGEGGGSSAELLGTYKEYHTTNHKDEASGYSWEYTLEVYSDSTYRMEYNAFYAIPFWSGTSERTVIQYGSYTTAASEEEGKVVYELGKPDRVVFFGMCGGYNGIPNAASVFADTADWANAAPVDEEAGEGIYFQLQPRGTGEGYATADQLLNTYGRTYKVTVDNTEGLHRMSVEVTSHGGEQINGYDNVFPEEDGWPE